MKRLIKKSSGPKTYFMNEDWFIYSYDNEGNLYFVNTEMWPEWEALPDGADQEPDAIEKYMLPIAKKKWNYLSWQQDKEIKTIWDMWPENELEEKFKTYKLPFNSKK